MATCNVWKGPIKLGSGTATNASATISSYTSTDARSEGRMNVTVEITSGDSTGSTFRARVITDGGTSLTLSEASPFAT
jgi:hypothetical protein